MKTTMRLSQLIALSLLISPILARADEPKPLKVLWSTGGKSHDYPGLTKYLTSEIRKRANVEFVVEFDQKTLAKKDYSKDYDAVVYYFTNHDKDAETMVNNIAAAVHAGKPAMFIHGALHSFRELKEKRDAYCEAIGLTSVQHDKLKNLDVKKANPHPITLFWPKAWSTSGDELYQNVRSWPNATPLLSAYSTTSKTDNVVAWVNQYGEGRVFGTTLGHDRHTADRPEYPLLLTNGLLWICDKLDEHGNPKPGYAANPN